MADNFWWELILKYRRQTLLVLVGLILAGTGIIFYRINSAGETIEIIEGTTESQDVKELVVEITGAIANPGVYTFSKDARVDDVIKMAGGFIDETDTSWVEKYINRAAKLVDGQKIFIPTIGSNQLSQTVSGTKTEALININTASISELDALPGIGPVYAQNITEQRPYSNIDELVSKGAIPKSTLDKIKDKITTY